MAGTLRVGGKVLATHNSETDEITITPTKLGAFFRWPNFNPTDRSGTTGNAPSGYSTKTENNYITFSNSDVDVNLSGTLTITFLYAGQYYISTSFSANHSNAYDYDTFFLYFGGTSNFDISPVVLIYGDAANNGSMFSTWSFLAEASTNQTVTILPKYRLSASGGTTAQHYVTVHTNVLYCGSL